MAKRKTKRVWLEKPELSDSYIKVLTGENGWTELKLTDCYRSINWDFGKPGDKRAKKKIAAVKKLIDEVYAFLHEKED